MSRAGRHRDNRKAAVPPWRAGVAGLAVLALVMLGLVLPQAWRADAADARPMDELYSTQDRGYIDITGNTLTTCDTSNSRCVEVQNRKGGPGANNDFKIQYLDLDSDPDTFNSSMAHVNVPANAKVLKAYLFWSASIGKKKGAAPTTNIDTIKFKVPGASEYVTVDKDKSVAPTGAATQIPGINHVSAPREAWADVTNLVARAGTGDYWAADVNAQVGVVDRYAGWALVLVVQDKTKPLRDLRVFSTIDSASGRGANARTPKATISGFITPPSGPVKAKIGTVVWEGDEKYKKDYLEMNGQRLSDALSPSGNFFNSSVSRDGVNITDRKPNYPNTMSVDAKVVDASGILNNNDTSADLKFGTNGDWFYISAMTSQIDLYLPDVQVNKTVKNLTALARGASAETPGRVGDILEYKLVAENNADAVARTVVVKDSIPADVEYVPGSLVLKEGEAETALTDAAGDDVGELANGQVVVRVGEGATAKVGGDIEPHSSRTVVFKVKVLTDAAGGTVTNRAAASYTSEFVPGKEFANPSNEVVRPIAKKADVGIAKTGPDQVSVGAPIDWTLTVTNAGPYEAKDVKVTDSQPEGVTGMQLVEAVDGCTVADNKLSCSWDALAKGQARTIKLRATAAGDGAQLRTVSNTAKVSTSSSDTNPNNDSSTAVTQVKPFADLDITKQADPASVVPGETTNWTMVVTNRGPAPSEQVQFADALPAGLTVAGEPTTTAGTCTHTDSSVACELGTVASGASVTVTVPARLDSAWNQTKAIKNTATVSSPVTEDPNRDNNSADGTVTPLAPLTDVAVAKTGPKTAVPGSEITYSLEVTVGGPSAATNVRVSDDLPAQLRFVAATVPGGQCENSGQHVTCALGDLPVGAQRTITVRANVAGDAEGSISNTAEVDRDTPDSNGDNDRSSTVTELTPLANLGISKTSPDANAAAGSQVTYTLEVSNAGPSTSKQLRVTDQLPATLEPVSVSSQAAECSREGATFTCTKAELAKDDSFTVTVVARVPADAQVGPDTTIKNTARVGAQTKDPQMGNNESTHSLSPTALADVTVKKTAGAKQFVPGKQASWTIEVSNLGPSDAHVVTLTDSLPAELVADTATATAGEGASCAVSEGALKCTADTLAAGGSFTVTLSGTVAADAQGLNISNTASVGTETPESNRDNNSSTATTPLTPSADLAVTKTAPEAVAAGEDISWQIQVTNNGPSRATPVTLVDPIPAHISNVRVTDEACRVSEQATDVTCTLAGLAPGESHSFTVVGTTDAGLTEATEVENTASVDSPVEDPNEGNDSATAVTNVTPKAKLTVQKAASVERFTAGEDAFYTIAVTNHGPSTARNVRISDPMPEGLTAVSATGPGECTIADNAVTCTLAALAADENAPATFKVNVKVGEDVSSDVTNAVEAGSDTPSPDGVTPRDEVTTPVGTSADVEVTKTASVDEVEAGGALTWTLTATNRGPSKALAVTVTDTLPAEVNLTEAPEGCTYAAQTRLLSCEAGDLAVGGSASFALPVTVNQDAAAGTVTNTAAAGSETDDPNMGNNEADSSVNVTQNSLLTLTKTAQSEEATPGQRLEWVVKVSNAGPSAAHGVTVTDTVPEGLSNVSATVVDGEACTVADRNVTCALGTLAVGERSVRIGADLDPGYSDKQVVNTAAVTTESPSNATAEHPLTATSTVPVVPSADLAMAKAVSAAEGEGPIAAGTRVSYVLTVTNKGPSVASEAAIADALPAELGDYRIDAANEGECQLAAAELATGEAEAEGEGGEKAAGQTLKCTHAEPLAVGQQWQVTLSAAVPANLVGTEVANTAETSWPGQDPNRDNNRSSASFTPIRAVDLGITKTPNREAVKAGVDVVWTVVVSNAGPSDAVDLKLTDAIDKRLRVTGIDAPEAFECAVEDAQLACTIGELPAGQSVTVKYTTKVKYGAAIGDLPNVAEVTDPATGQTVSGNAKVKVEPWPLPPGADPGTPGGTDPGEPGGTDPANPPSTDPGKPDADPSTSPSPANPDKPGAEQGGDSPKQPGSTQAGAKKPNQPGSTQAGAKKPNQPKGVFGRLAATGIDGNTLPLLLALVCLAALAVLGVAGYNRRR